MRTPTAPPPVPGVRRFRLYAAAAFAFAWVPIMWTAFHIDRGFSVEQYARMWAVYYAAMVLAELPWGWVADRFGKRPLLIAGPLVLGATFVVLGRATDVQTCLVAMAVMGSAHAMISGADSAWLYELLLAADRTDQALHEEAVAHRWRLLGVCVADLLGGFAAFHFGTAAAFDLAALAMLGGASLAYGLPRVGGAGRDVAKAAPGDPIRLLDDLRRPGVLWCFAWFAAVFVLLRVGFQLYQPSLLHREFSDLRIHGATFAALNLVAGTAAVFVPAVYSRLGERGTALAVLVLIALAFSGLAVAGPLALLPCLALQQVSFAFLQPVGRTALNHRVPSRDRASLLSAQSVAGRLAFAGVLGVAGGASILRDLDHTYAVLAIATATMGAALMLRAPAPPPIDRA